MLRDEKVELGVSSKELREKGLLKRAGAEEGPGAPRTLVSESRQPCGGFLRKTSFNPPRCVK